MLSHQEYLWNVLGVDRNASIVPGIARHGNCGEKKSANADYIAAIPASGEAG